MHICILTHSTDINISINESQRSTNIALYIHNVSFINKSSQYFLRMQYKIEKHRVKNE